jgi:centromere/kinetochore protein ZW10
LHKKKKQEEDHVEFLEKEVSYNAQLLKALHGIKQVQEVLNQAEEAGTSGRILDALHFLSCEY